MNGDYDVRAGALWSGGVVIAVISALAAMVAQVIMRSVFDIVVTTDGSTALPPLTTFGVALAIVVIGVAALHLFLVAVPRGRTLWQLLGSLVLVASVVPVSQLSVDTTMKLLLMVLHLVVYVFAVPTLVALVPRVATRKVS